MVSDEGGGFEPLPASAGAYRRHWRAGAAQEMRRGITNAPPPSFTIIIQGHATLPACGTVLVSVSVDVAKAQLQAVEEPGTVGHIRTCQSG